MPIALDDSIRTVRDVELAALLKAADKFDIPASAEMCGAYLARGELSVVDHFLVADQYCHLLDEEVGLPL